MAGVDANGLTIKRLPDILEELQAAIKAQYGNDTPTDANSFFGILNTIYGASDAEVWELLQTLNNSFRVSSANDIWLDDIAAYLKLTRLQPTTSKGELSLFGVSGTVVPIGTEFSDLNGKAYVSTTEGSLDTGTSRTPIIAGTTNGSGTLGEPSITYTITINGDIYSKQFLWGSTSLQDVAEDMKALIGDQPNYYAESYLDNNPEFITESIFVNGGTRGTILNIINKNAVFPITISVGVIQSPTPAHYSFDVGGIAKGSLVSVFSDKVDVISSIAGAINTSANTLVNINTPVVGLNSVYNEKAIIVGRDLENDEEFRLRIQRDATINGYATQQAITASLRQVDGVSFVDVQVNKTYTTDSEGRPPKSFECIVVGGDDNDIAETILNKGAAGIESYGNTTVIVDDDQGNPQTIKFTRASEIFVWVKVNYTKNDEEFFPTNGEDLIASAVLSYGQTLSTGADVIPKRFFGSIYNSTTGIEDVTVTVATSLDAITEPPAIEFTTDVIDIASNEISSFTNYRIEIIED